VDLIRYDHVVVDTLDTKGRHHIDKCGLSQCMVRIDFDNAKSFSNGKGEFILLPSIADEILTPEHPWVSLWSVVD
jgi:hypothetical protein